MGCCNFSKSVAEETKMLELVRDDIKEMVSVLAPSETLTRNISNILIPIRRCVFAQSSDGVVEDRYKICEILGQGGFSTVRRAVHTETSLQRAVKIIAKNSISDKQISHLVDEVETLKVLDHPNIIHIIETIENNSKLNIITELCTGGELFERILNFQPFTENTAANYMHQILSGLMHIHSSGYVHRDLKPENILFLNESKDSTLKIIDFGLSKRISSNSKLSKFIGTVINIQAYYTAPELIQGTFDKKCDVWSCGVILYIILCGTPPFNGKNESEIFSKISRGVFNFSGSQWTKISKEAKEFIKKLLCKDVSKRLSAEEAWNDDWVQSRAKGIVEDDPVGAKTLKKLAGFRANSHLQQATMQYIASNLTTSQQIEEIRKAFISIDKNGDGHLSINELRLGFNNITLSSTIKIEEVLSSCDSDLNGMIDYNEFLTATLNWQKILSQEMLESAFKAFDKDRNGTICIIEIKDFFGGNEDSLDYIWNKLLKEADINEDGVIDLQEFKTMMLTKIGQPEI